MLCHMHCNMFYIESYIFKWKWQHDNFIKYAIICVKGIVSKMKILSSFTHPQVDPNLYECVCSEHKGRYSEEWGKQSSIFLLLLKSMVPQNSLITNFLQNIFLCVQNKHIHTGLDLQGPNPPPSAVGEPKTTDNSSQWYVSCPCYISSNIHKCLQNKRELSMPVAFSISVLSRDRRSKAFSSRTADPSNLRPVMHQSKIAVETKCNSIKLAFLNIRSLKNKSFVINDLITTNNLDFMFLIETWLEHSCSATVLTETAPPNFNFISVCRTVRRGGGVAALFKDVYQCKQVSFGQYLSFEYLGIVLKGAPRILFIIIYRPPKYSPAFVEEFTELLSMISSELDCFAIAGDFNIHIDNAEIKTALNYNRFKHFWPDSACAWTNTQSWTHSRFTHQ